MADAAASSSEPRCFSMRKAEQAFLNGDFEGALKNMFACIMMLPVERRERYEDQFAAALHGWIAVDQNNAGRAVNLYPQMKELFPVTVRTKMAIVRAVQGTDNGRWIINCLPICRDAMELATREEDLVALRIARVNLTTIPFPQWHIRMINDVNRNEAFAKALNKTIKSRSSVVFDIGSGTGLLSVMAAKKTNLVIALEESICLTMISKEVLKRNGVESRVSVYAKNSTMFETNQKADVIVSETMDCCVFGEKIVETFLDAHARFAHEKTVFIPSQATVFVRLFKCREIFDIHCQDYAGVRYRSEYVRINDTTTEQPYWCASAGDFAEFEFLSAPKEIHTVNFSNVDELKQSLSNSGSLQLTPTKDGVAHGFAIHFTSDLTGDGIIIDSSNCRAWDLGIIPFKEPCLVKSGKLVDIAWKLEYNRLDIYNKFYAESLQRAEDCLRYETASLEQLQKIRDDSYFKAMMNEIPKQELPFTVDISSSIPAQCVINTVDSQKPAKVVITSLHRFDGSLDQETFFRIEEFTGYRDFIEKIVPSKVRILGRLFTSDRVHFEARPDASAHCQVDLTNVSSFNLREMREIRLTQRPDIVMTSDEFVLYEFNLNVNNFRHDVYTTVTRDVKVQPNRSGSDGVIYEFEILGIKNSKLRAVAAFLFQNRLYNDEELTLVFDMHLGEMLISIRENL